MYRYIHNKTKISPCGILNIHIKGDIFYPVILHATVGQDRPIGDIRTFGEHQHDLYHLVLYTSGQGAYFLNGKLHTAEPQTLVIVSPGQSHDFVTHLGNAVYSELTFSFETVLRRPLMLCFEKLLEYLTGAYVHITNPMRLSDAETNLFKTLLTEIMDLAGLDHALSEFYLRYALVKLFHYMVQACVKPIDVGGITDERLIRVRQYIHQNYNTTIRIEELAQLAGLSKGYLFRAFAKTFSLSPLAYQKKLRLEAARTLLRCSALRCSEIAARCGYENVHFFHRIFKQTFGITPSQYRKRSRIQT